MDAYLFSAVPIPSQNHFKWHDLPALQNIPLSKVMRVCSFCNFASDHLHSWFTCKCTNLLNLLNVLVCKGMQTQFIFVILYFSLMWQLGSDSSPPSFIHALHQVWCKLQVVVVCFPLCSQKPALLLLTLGSAQFNLQRRKASQVHKLNNSACILQPPFSHWKETSVFAHRLTSARYNRRRYLHSY